MTNTNVPFSYYKINKITNKKSKRKKLLLRKTEHFRRHGCVVYNQSKVSSPKKFRTRHVTITLDRTRHDPAFW